MEELIMKSFIETTRHILQHTAGIDIAQTNSGRTKEPFVSLGILCMLSFTGKFSGRYVMDLSYDLVQNIVNIIVPADAYHENTSHLHLSAVSNLCNSIAENLHGFLAGDLLSNMQLAPPIILVGEALIFDPDESMIKRYTTEFGEFKLYFSYYDDTQIH